MHRRAYAPRERARASLTTSGRDCSALSRVSCALLLLASVAGWDAAVQQHASDPVLSNPQTEVRAARSAVRWWRRNRKCTGVPLLCALSLPSRALALSCLRALPAARLGFAGSVCIGARLGKT